MYRFLVHRRWLVRILAGLVLVVACVRLGMWQLDRADQREANNAVLEANLAAEAVPVDQLLSTDEPLDENDQWRTVVARGEYDVDRQLLLRLRPVDGQRGVHAITPLVTTDGAVLLVDRGFVVASGSEIPDVPDPEVGPVTVTARVREPEVGRGTGGDPDEGTIRYVDVDALSSYLDQDTYQAWTDLVAEEPAAPDPLIAISPPEIESGPHLSYALQWFAFAVVGIVGFVVLIRLEARGDADRTGPRPREPDAAERAAETVAEPTPDQPTRGRT